MPILTFRVTYLYNGCKRYSFINTDMDLDMLDFEEMEGFVMRNKMFLFDQILNWHYVDIVGEYDATIEEEEAPKCNPTLKWGKKKTDKTSRPQTNK